MSITTSQPTRARSRGQLAGAVTGIVLIVVGGLAAAAAIGLIAVFGTSGRLDTGPHQIVSSGSALVTDVGKIQNTRGVGTITGWPTLQVSAGGGNSAGVFIGIGPARDVDAYLAGVAVDKVTDLDLHPFDLTVVHSPGTAATPPTAQTFWSVSATSTSTASLSWPVDDGDYRLVVMNADGAATVIAQAQLQLVLPNAFGLSIGILGGAVLVTAVGIVVLVLARPARRRRVSLDGMLPLP